MSANRKKPPELSMLQVKADIVAAESCLAEAEKSSVKLAKYLRGQCGYHLQQACEKMIKLQLYHSLITVDYGKIYKHDLADLESYARSEGVTLAIPKYIADRLALISTWEAEGCYDTHFVVRTDTLIQEIPAVL